MKTKLVFEIDNFDGEFSLGAPDPDDADNYISAGSDGEDDDAIAKSLNLSPEAVKQIRMAFCSFAEGLVEKLHKDLEDLYRAIPDDK